MDRVPFFPSFARRCAWLGAGTSLFGAAAVLARGTGPTLARLVPSAPANLSAWALPVVSLLALVGPTGLTFPCWAVESSSPGARVLRWIRAKSRG
jgi:hypothetical protein